MMRKVVTNESFPIVERCVDGEGEGSSRNLGGCLSECKIGVDFLGSGSLSAVENGWSVRF